jgi:hypothetical protein
MSWFYRKNNEFSLDFEKKKFGVNIATERQSQKNKKLKKTHRFDHILNMGFEPTCNWKSTHSDIQL